VFRFLEKYEFEITAYDAVMAYKAVHQVCPSMYAGPESIKRKLVDPDRGNPCSVGLHVGTRDYAEAFARCHGGVLLKVSVNPIDAISVPSDDARKMRVCRYRVLGEVSGHEG
jgi:hypothetical protein